MYKVGNTVYLQTGDCVTANDILQLFTPSSGTHVLSNATITAAGNPLDPNNNPAADLSTIVFDGTKFENCTFIGINTSLVFHFYTPTFSNVTFQGTFLSECLYPELFGAKGNGTDDDTVAMQTCLNTAIDTHIYRIRLLPRTYLITSTLYYKGNLSIEGTHHYNMYHTGVGSRQCTTITATLGTPPMMPPALWWMWVEHTMAVEIDVNKR